MDIQAGIESGLMIATELATKIFSLAILTVALLERMQSLPLVITELHADCM